MKKRKWLLLAWVVAIIACGGDDAERDAAAADSLAAQAEATRTAELLAPVRSVAGASIEFGDLATQNASSEDVRGYAQVIVADHRAVVSTLDSISARLGAREPDTVAAQDLARAVRTAHSGLEALTGAAFDLAYIRAEAESHRLLLDRLDEELIPAVRGADIRTLLQQVRAMTDAHLTRARQLLAQLLGQPDPTPRPPPQPRPDTMLRQSVGVERDVEGVDERGGVAAEIERGCSVSGCACALCT
jgi:putative membrane protein